MRQLEMSTLSDQDISSDLLVHTYTADADRAILIRVGIDQVAGNGDYSGYVTLQEAGSGSWYKTHVATLTAASGVSAILFPSIMLPVNNTDKVRVYVKGLASDTTTPDITTRIFELSYLRPTTPDNTLDVAATGEAGVDLSNIKQAADPTTLTNITVPTITSVTNVVDANLKEILGTVLTETSGYIAAAFKKFFNVQNPMGTVNSIPDAAPGGAGGLPIVGSQMDLVNAPNSTAITAIQSGLATSDNQTTMQATLDKLNTMIEADGAVYRYTENALEEGPSGEATVSDADKTDIAQRAWDGDYVPSRTITQTAEEAGAALSGTNIVFHRGDYNYFTITVGDISARTKLWLTVKNDKRDTDAQAVIQLTEADGLTRLNGAEPDDATDGELEVLNETLGTVAIKLKADAAKELAEVNMIPYDVQVLEETGPRTVRQALCTITADVTRAIS